MTRPASLLALAALSAAGSAAAATAPVPRTYESACGACHTNNGYGVQRLAARLGKDRSILTARTDLQGPYIRLVVRRGFQSMPAMSKVEVSDAELDAIVQTLTARQAPAR
jgi:mono/diheme cytochrome c family protein